MNKIADWWSAISCQWSWSNPSLLLAILSILVTGIIPVAIWRLGVKQAQRDTELRTQQTEALRRQRRDALIDIVSTSADATHLGLLWQEINEYHGSDRGLLLAALRTNAALALPGASVGVTLPDVLRQDTARDYVNGLDRRYTFQPAALRAFPGLIDFIEHAKTSKVELDVSRVVAVVVGPSAAVQRPSHTFFRDLIAVLPEAAASLLYRVEDITDAKAGGLRLNVLTGTFLAIKDIELGRLGARATLRSEAREEIRSSVPTALAQLMHRENLRSFDRWSTEGSTEPVTATLAWLVRTVGWLVDADEHCAMRMTQNLAVAIRSGGATEQGNGWGIDEADVRSGLERIREEAPYLWELYGPEIEAAASEIGPWASVRGR